jgi:hypothetical protein
MHGNGYKFKVRQYDHEDSIDILDVLLSSHRQQLGTLCSSRQALF